MSDEIKEALDEEKEVKLDDAVQEIIVAAEEKPITDNDEIAAFNKDVLGKLESPLIVHKKTDASYQEMASMQEMSETHAEEDAPTLKRHRYKNDNKKKGRGFKVFLCIIVILAAVFAGLYYGGVVSFEQPTTTEKTTKAQTEETTESLEEKYKDTIVIKNTYIFVDGKEVDGIEGLQNAIKYETQSTTRYRIIIEGTSEDFNDDFYNLEVLPILTELKFFGDDTVVDHIASTGLMAAAETTTVEETTESTTKATTETTTKA